MTDHWTDQQVRGAIWTLRTVINLAQLTEQEADAVTAVILPKFVAHSGLDLAAFRAIIAAMDPDEELRPRTQH
jgi:hypothetical protein